MDRVTRMAEHERAGLDPGALGARRRNAAEEESLKHRGRRCGVAADPVESGVGEVMEAARREPGEATDHAGERSAEGEAYEERCECERAAEQRVVQHRHLYDDAPQPFRRG